MNEQRRSPQPAPQPMCTALAPLVPLLSLGKLDPDEAVAVRAHIATCDFCQGQLRDFDAVRDALRRQGMPARAAGPVPAGRAPMLTLATILSAADGTDEAGDDDERDGHVAAPSLTPLLPATRPGATRSREPGRGRWTGFSALAAALLLALLAGALFRGRTGPAVAIRVPVPGLGTLTEFPLPTAGSELGALVAGSDGDMWFTEPPSNSCSSGRIGRITPRGVITEFDLSLPKGVVLGCVIQGFNGLAAGPNGTIWFTVYSTLPSVAGKIGRLSPRDGQVTWFVPPNAGSAGPTIAGSVGPIVSGPDGSLWFVRGDFTLSGGASSGRAAIGRIMPSGDIKEFPLPSGYPTPSFLTAGPDGNLWFVTGDERALGHYVVGRMSTAGAIITEFPIPLSKLRPNSITMIAAGPDGNLWFTAGGPKLSDPGQIGRITPQGTITTFRMPASDAHPPAELTAGPDGNLWFVAGDMQTLSRITPQGDISEFALPSGLTIGGIGITLGPDGNLWFTTLDPHGDLRNTPAAANTIDRLELQRSG